MLHRTDTLDEPIVLSDVDSLPDHTTSYVILVLL